MTEFEKDPLLPSGPWKGFYCYEADAEKHKMDIELTFCDMTVSGSGIDDVGTFHWEGNYDLTHFKANITKQYLTHKVWYKGAIDENGIWGNWELNIGWNNITGGFHIWPKKQNQGESTMEVGKEISIVMCKCI